MMGYGYNHGGGHWGLWVLMIVAMVVFWAALAWVIVTLVRHRVPPAGSLAAPLSRPPSDALRILDERLAHSEIDADEYKSRRALIEGTA